MYKRNARATRRLARYAAHLGVGEELHNIHNDGDNFGGSHHWWSTTSLTNENTNATEVGTNSGLSTNDCAGEGPGSKNITITSHVLDTNVGKPAVGVRAVLERKINGHSSLSGWEEVAVGKTDSDGRIKSFPVLPSVGSYRVTFDVADYFINRGMEKPFYTSVVINFEVLGHEHYHIPLLLAPHGYSTYRGS